MNGSLPKKTLMLWRIRLTCVLLLLCGILFFFFIPNRALLILFGVLAVLYLMALLWYLPAYFKAFSLTVNDSAIIVRAGVFFKTTRIMPFPRLVFARCYTSPLARTMGVTCIMLKAARGFLFVPEIPLEEARRLIKGISGGKQI